MTTRSFRRSVAGLLVGALAFCLGGCHRTPDPVISERPLSQWIASLDDRDVAVQFKAVHAIAKLEHPRRKLPDGTFSPRERAVEAEAARLPLQQLGHGRPAAIGLVLAAQYDLLVLFGESDSKHTESALQTLAWSDNIEERLRLQSLLKSYTDQADRVTDVALAWTVAAWMKDAPNDAMHRGLDGQALLISFPDAAWPKVAAVEPMGTLEAVSAYALRHEVAAARKVLPDPAGWADVKEAGQEFHRWQNTVQGDEARIKTRPRLPGTRAGLKLMLCDERCLPTKATAEERCLFYRQQTELLGMYDRYLQAEARFASR